MSPAVAINIVVWREINDFQRPSDRPKILDATGIIEELHFGAGMEALFLSSWFDEIYLYRIEEGDPRYSPSKIEAVRRDGGDFDDLHLASLKRRLVSHTFPQPKFEISVETDEFRRFVRIYVDFASMRDDRGVVSNVSRDEIRTRLAK